MNPNETATVSVARDINNMHAHFGVHEALRSLTKEQLIEFVSFRLKFLQEELNEGLKALEEKSAEELVDSMIDLAVVSVGTLDLFEVNFDLGWTEVLEANLAKEAGVNPTRPNKFGLPDLIKPEGWTAPSHEGNHGLFAEIFKA